LRELEARRSAAPVRIVAVTAHAFAGDHLAFRLAGMDAVLTKPIDPAVYARLLGGGADLPAAASA
jgi:CheY-like chemotaxis protein